MPYVTSVERIAAAEGKAEGMAEGKVKGKAEILVTIIRQQIDPLPQEIEDRIHRLSVEKLDLLGGVVTKMGDLKAVETWLSANETPANADSTIAN